MTNQSRAYMGIDIGSVSLNIAIIDKDLRLQKSIYRRTNGQPIPVLIDVFEGLKKDFPHFNGVVGTGSGRSLIADILGIDGENEILTQARATSYFHPEVRTVIEIGGQDSKLIYLERDERSGEIVIVDHALNEICAAGTGSFLDQQAYRLGISIDKEFGELALSSKKPATIAGRCSVFAKSDMVHLQQEGVPKEDIVAGFCYALARNYISNLGRGKRFEKPVAFQGGVAANKGVVKAFEDLLELEPGELIIPEHFDIMGAMGAAIVASEKGNELSFEVQKAIGALRQYLSEKASEDKRGFLKGLVYKENSDGHSGNGHDKLKAELFTSEKKKVYMGIDVGAASTNVVILDEDKNLLAKKYLLTKGEPIGSVKMALEDVAQEIEGLIEVQGVGVTGSGRYFVGDFVGCDVVVNEITAQAKATLDMDSTVDTIIEIGGQDSKYIRLKSGSVVDFEMNKVCAAGTGSFLQEQADRLGIKIEEEFSELALHSKAPVDLGTRCTVFMESDLIHHQQVGSPKADLVAGLSYSIANNYIEKVVGNKKIGQRIYFQGGVAGNKGVVAAFENILENDVIVPEDHNVTGAIGAALIAMEREDNRQGSNFIGFDLEDRNYQIKTFECKHCPNCCEIKQVFIEGESRAFYGGICDRYEMKEEKESDKEQLPDLFKEREEMLMSYYNEDEFDLDSPVIGIPRMLMFFEQFPLWTTFLSRLGFRVVLSDKTNRKLINKGMQEILAETCYPVKIAYGHMVNLTEKEVDYIFVPSIIDLKKEREDVARSYNCPFIQGIPFMLRPAFEDKVKILSPTIFMAKDKRLKKQLLKIGKELGKKGRDVSLAVTAALRAQQEFEEKRLRRGQEILENLEQDNEAVVIIGKPYNVHDVGLNLNISKKLRKLGILAIPYDFLPLDRVELPSHYSNLVWKNEQNLLRGAMFAKSHKNLNPIMITNYGCGPDAFFTKYLEDIMEEDPCLVIEVDEHSGDAGMTTRIEAYIDTISGVKKTARERKQEDLNVFRPSKGIDFFTPKKKIKELDRTVYIPYISGHSTIMAAAFRSVGIEAEVLPEPDELSDELGRRHASSKECHPYLLTTGDFVRMTQMEGFDPDRSAFLMLNYDGSCRMSQYATSQKLVLKRLGLERIPIIAPLTSIRHDEFTRLLGLNWAMALWKGILATDTLLKKLLHTRPYELNEGETERIYEKAIDDIAAAIVEGDFSQAFNSAIEAIDEIPTEREDRPIIGIVGEFYSCMNSWANNDFIKQLESLGAEVRYGPSITDYFVYFNEVYPHMYFSKREYIASLYYYIRRHWLMGWKDRIEATLGEDLADYKIPKVEQRVKSAAPYVSDSIDPVITVNVSKAEEYAAKKCSGIANLIVLNCLYGTLCTAIYKKVQREHNRIPMLTLIYDGLKQTNEKTRIEAFVRQAKLYEERFLS